MTSEYESFEGGVAGGKPIIFVSAVERPLPPNVQRVGK